MNKRGQIAIYVIIGAIIAVAAISVYIFSPDIIPGLAGDLTPESFLRNCIEPSIGENVALLASQGGYADPSGFVTYKDAKVKYLCYESQYYTPCKVQQPLLKNQFEKELTEKINPEVERCFAQMKEEFERRGYRVDSEEGELEVELAPERILVKVKNEFSATRDETQSFGSVEFSYPSKMYDLLMISTSIVQYEATYGNSETTLYTQNYPNLDIQKDELDDGTTIYTVGDVTTKENFRFASRSLVWPAGYGLEAPE